jgi:hypothetical protein
LSAQIIQKLPLSQNILDGVIFVIVVFHINQFMFWYDCDFLDHILEPIGFFEDVNPLDSKDVPEKLVDLKFS